MNKNNIKYLDFNLIKAFDALMRTRNVTKAADEIGIGQSAMSHALSRLRTVFNDELFIRMPEGMKPTKKAEQIIIPVRSALAELEKAFQTGKSFDPRNETFKLTIALSDYTETILLPLILQECKSLAPNLSLKVIQFSLDNIDKILDDNVADLAVGFFRKMGPKYLKERVFTDYRSCIYSKNLVQKKTPISMKQYLSYGHILQNTSGDNSSQIDRELAKMDKTRNIVLTTPWFTNIPRILQTTPLIASWPALIAKNYPKFPDLVESDLPFDVPEIKISMLWHITSDQDPANLWMRDVIRKVVKFL